MNFDGYWNNRALTKIPIKVYSGYNSTRVEIFRGYFRLGQKQVKSKTIEVTAQSYFYVFKKPIVNKEVLENKRVDEILLRACQDCGVTDYELAKSDVIIPVIDLKEYATWIDVIKGICEATVSIFHYEDGKFVFRPLYSVSEVSQYTFTVDNLEDLTQSKSIDTVKNSIIISSDFKSVGQTTKLSENLVNIQEEKNELYTITLSNPNRILVKNFPLYKDTTIVDGEYKYKTDATVFNITSGSPNFGQKINITDIDVDNGYIYLDQNLQEGIQLSVSYKYLQLQLNPNQQRVYTVDLTEQGKDIQLLVAAYKNNSQFDNGEKVPYSTISISNAIHLVDIIEEKDNKIRFTLKNSTTSIIVISTLMVAGKPIKSFSPIKAKFRNSGSITTWETENELSINNNFIVSEDQAKLLGNFLYTNLANPVEKVSLPVVHHLPFLKLGRCTVQESSTGINYDFLITNIDHDLNNFTTKVEAIKYPTLTDVLAIDWLQKDSNENYIGSSFFNDTTPPTPSSLTIQYNNNVDGTKNIALSWSDTADSQSPIDGYELFISVKSTFSTYTPDYGNDVVLKIAPEMRGLILRNLPLKETITNSLGVATDYFKYYAFAIRPFRVVHPALVSNKQEFFSGTGIETQFYVTSTPLTVLASDRVIKVGGVTKTETTDFTVDINSGLFTFTLAPITGTNNIEINYKSTYLDGNLKGDFVKFYDIYKKLDEFVLYTGTTIENAVSGKPLESTSLSLLNQMINGLQKNKTYDSSLRFDDFRGMRLLTGGASIIERLSVGQIEPGKYGILGKNDSNEQTFRLDENGVVIGSTGEFQGTVTGNLNGTPATTVLNNISTAQTDATNAQAAANTANSLLADIANDNKLTPVEKQSTKLLWDSVVAEKSPLDAQATTFGITTEKTTYDNAYGALNTYITPLLADLTVTSDIVGTTFRTSFSDYYTSKIALLNKVSSVAKTLADNAQAAADAAQADATNAQTSANTANTEISNMSSDDKISPVEKLTLKKDWDAIVAEKSILDTQATTYSITTEKTTYDNAYDTLNTYLNTTKTVFSNMATTTDLGTGGGATLRTNFSNYYTAKVNLLNKVANVTKTIADNSVQQSAKYNGVAITLANGIQIFNASDVEVLKMGNLGTGVDGFKVTHTDGSYTQMTAGGFERSISGENKPYFYLWDFQLGSYGATKIYTWQDTEPWSDPGGWYTWSDAQCDAFLTPPTITLPAAFRGKNFKIFPVVRPTYQSQLALEQFFWTEPAANYYLRDQKVEATNIDYVNGTFKVRAYVHVQYTYNSTTRAQKVVAQDFSVLVQL